MENEIIRKSTSITLMAIMVAGGLTFAIPGVLPAAYADNALYVSAESEMFENYFVGAQVIEVIVNDDQYRTDENRGDSYMPIVTVDDNPLPMYQATSGNWYGYFVEKDKAMEAQNENLFDFGDRAELSTDECPTVDDIECTTDNFKFEFSETRNVLAEPPGRPAIYAFGFTEGSDIDVELENGADTETVTLSYDTVEDYAGLMLDRGAYPQMAHIHLEVTDAWLNIDPTSEDVWYFNTVENNEASYRGTSNYVALQDTGLMCDDNCVLLINPDRQGTNENGVLKVASNMDHEFDDDAEKKYYPIRLEEGSPNSGVFTNTDDDDAANLMITDDARRGTTATIDYNDSPIDIAVANSFASIDIQLDDDTWNSGEEIPVVITDDDANKNGASDEDMLVSDPDTIIPTLVTGSPVTLDDNSMYNADGQYADREAYMDTETTTFSKRGTVSVDGNTLVLLYDKQPLSLLNHGDDFKGFAYFNYHFESVSDSVSITLTNLNSVDAVVANNCINNNSLDMTLSCLEDAGAISSDDRENFLDFDDIPDFGSDACSVTLVDNGDASGYVNIDKSLNMLGSCDADESIVLVISGDMLNGDDAPVVADFMSFGYNDDGVQGSERVADQIIRIEAEETDDNTGVFEGALEYIMVNQLNVLDKATYDSVDPISDAPIFIVFEDMTDEDAPKVTYLDLGADGVATQVSDRQEAPSHSGIVTFDSGNYKIADTVTVTLNDPDLNTDSELIDIYTVVRQADSSVFGKAGEVLTYGMLEYNQAAQNVIEDCEDDNNNRAHQVDCEAIEVKETFGDLGRLLDITFDDADWPKPNTSGCSFGGDGDGLHATGFSLVETGVATGVFVGDFQIPAKWCEDGEPETTTGYDIEVNYVDFRDASGEIIEVGDSSAVGAHTGSVSLDRTVYPVPFGLPENFGHDRDHEADPDNESFFPIHSTGFDGDSGLKYINAGDLTIHIRVTDTDYDVSATGQDTISQAVEGTDHTGPVKVMVKRGSSYLVLGYAGGPEETGDRAGFLKTDSDKVRQFGPIQEIAPDAGVFEIDIELAYTDGPSSGDCPNTAPDGYPDYLTDNGDDNRFATSDHFCILQGDTLEVEYRDPLDASGDPNTVTDSATFDLRNGVLQSDKSQYVIGTDMILTLIEPDFDLDNDQAETYDLDLIEWDSDAATLTMGDSGGEDTAFDPEPTDFRETGDSTGIFQTIIEIPAELEGDRLERNEAITLEYVDWGPAGANYVGDEDEDVRLDVVTSDFGATIELDQKVYTWTDKVYITIVAPDHNYDSDLVDEIGDTSTDPLKISTRGHDLDRYKLVETGTDTGIFTGEIILTGFSAHDADGDGVQSDADGETGGDGPTSGKLQTTNDDGLSVSYEYSEDVTIVTSALVRWNIGEVQWLESSYPASGTGIVRVIDPDMNLNPEAVDNFDINVWSDSDAGGIDLTVTETNEATGIFEGTVSFTIETESSGHRLRAAEGDTVTAEYEDRTLPDPYSTRDDLDVTATTLIGTIVPPLERAPASNLRVVDSFGNSLDTVSVDQQVQITADLTNGQNRNQAFAYLVQVQDANGVVVSLAWITGSLTPSQSFSPAESWTPDMAGTYTVTAFVWESLDNPTALSPPITTEITVQ